MIVSDSCGRWRTNSAGQLPHVPVWEPANLARDEEADASEEGALVGVPIKLSRPLSGDAVQQDVQQQGRTITRMRNRRHRWLPAEFGRTWHAPVVRIEVVRPRWPLLAVKRRSMSPPGPPYSL
jgi:hypothetical protein